jgi:post-segregation antitoxin (ccd killing protein)
MNIRSSSVLAAASLALALTALSAPALADGVPAPRHTHKHPTAHRAAPMATAARKPNDSGVTLQYRVDGTPQVGRGVPVVLQFDGVSDADGATVRLRADAGLNISGSDTLALPAGKRTSTTVTVVSDREGLAYLNVFITQGGATSAMSIPVQTGTAAPVMKSSGELKATPEGDHIISMPAK